jgi:hypothetical protein
VYIIANVIHTNNINVSNNGKWQDRMSTSYPQLLKKVQNIPKYSFNFMSTDMLSTRINVDTYLSVKTLLTLQFLHFHSLYDYLIINNSYLCFIDFIGVTTHIGPIEEKDKFRIYQNSWYLALDWVFFLFLSRKQLQNFQHLHACYETYIELKISSIVSIKIIYKWYLTSTVTGSKKMKQIMKHIKTNNTLVEPLHIMIWTTLNY